ncbi:stalk domain-containing protein [Paenibacillus sp. FSL H8-0079]|uniref:stalk domain-containing protein n=1 Tax=Paenibacillus sp. FSL H8-0079 TaxID=2921375 RepID=UPI0030EF2A6A
MIRNLKKVTVSFMMLVVLCCSLAVATSAESKTELPQLSKLPMETGGWSKFAVSPNGKLLFSGGGEKAYLWYLDSGRNKEITEIGVYSNGNGFLIIGDAAFSPDGKLLAVSISKDSSDSDQWVVLIDSESGSVVDKINISTGWAVNSIQFSNDGKVLIFGALWDRIGVINVASHEELYSIPKEEYIDIIRTNPKRNEFAVNSAYKSDDSVGAVQIRNTSTGEIIKSLGDSLPLDKSRVLDMKYSPNGRYFLVSLKDNLGTYVFDAEQSYRQVAVLKHYGSISFSKDSNLAIIGNYAYLAADNFINFYKLKVKDSDENLNPELTFLTADGKYLISQFESYNPSGLVILDASKVSMHLTGIRIEPESIAVGVNDSQDLKVKGIYSDGTVKNLDIEAIKWTVKEFYKAEIRGSILYGLGSGATELTAEYGGYKTTVPVIVAEYPSRLKATVTGAQVKMTWAGISSSDNFVGYNLYRRTTNGTYGDVPLTDFPLKTTSYIDANIDSSQQYYYVVRAVYSDNMESRASNEVSSTLGQKRIVLQVGNPKMKVNDESKEIDPGKGVTPVMYKGRLVLPVRSLIEELGGKLVLQSDDKKITIDLNSKKIELWIGKNVAVVNGSEKTLDVAPVVINGRTMLPLRFIGENLGVHITWDGTNQSVEVVM